MLEKVRLRKTCWASWQPSLTLRISAHGLLRNVVLAPRRVWLTFNYVAVCVYPTEAATETIFENICSFLPAAPVSGFVQEAFCVHQTDTNFSGGYLCSVNRYNFSRGPFYVFTEHIQVCQRHLFSYRTYTDLPEASL